MVEIFKEIDAARETWKTTRENPKCSCGKKGKIACSCGQAHCRKCGMKHIERIQLLIEP